MGRVRAIIIAVRTQ